MGKYVHKFSTVTDYDAVKYTLIRPHISKVQESSQICWKKAVNKSNGSNIEYVDLGLPSDNLWAAMNLGASTTADLGSQYAWGELTTKETFTPQTYRWTSEYTKYNPTDGKIYLDLEDDVAHTTLGSRWYIPTIEDINELIQNTTYRYDSNNSYYILTSKLNGNQIIFPSLNIWSNKRYPTSSSTPTAYQLAYKMGLYEGEWSNYLEIGDAFRFSSGCYIRPVYK